MGAAEEVDELMSKLDDDSPSKAPACSDATDWVTDRAPTEDDARADSGHCLEVTYQNGLLGWEPFWELRNWKPGNGWEVVAWRRIRPAYATTPDACR